MGELIAVGALVDGPEVSKLVARLALDLAFATIVIHLVYFRLYKKRKHLFLTWLVPTAASRSGD